MSFRYPVNGHGTLSRSNSLRALELGNLASHSRPKAPVSPPETERSAPTLVALERATMADQRSIATETLIEGDHSPEESIPFPTRHIRRAPSIHYHQANTSLRTQGPRSAPRWLVVVMPPSSLNVEPVLGHTLAMGPPGRFQSGILMPLYPTMYAQLTAIAKEFNLPSTSGVCIYLHVSKPNLQFTPRISDETWQLLWSSYFNDDVSSPHPTMDMTLPICGKIEFDVDIRRARWYDAWLNRHDRLISFDAGIPASVANTMSRWYNEHRETRETPADEMVEPINDRESVSMAVPHTRAKPVPRPLTLSTHGEGHSNRKFRIITSQDGDGSESIASHRRAARRLSPVIQSAAVNVNAHTAVQEKEDLDTLVRNWRAATPMVPTIPGREGESLQDPDTMTSREPSELDMNDFQWSVSSPGPASPLQWSPEWSRRAPSVDLDGRVAGSVMLTPSVATSWGPGESVWSPMPSTSSLHPTPGLADRMLDDAPLTPTTCTSWGAPSDLPLITSTSFQFRVQTPDLAARQYFSRPPTPSTATTWGAPSEWAETPASLFYRVPSPDVGLREMGSVPCTPSTATSWGAPEYWPPSPIELSRPGTPDISSREFDDGAPLSFQTRQQPWNFVWPFFDSTTDVPTISQVLVERDGNLRREPSAAREVSPYPFVWPFFNTSALPTIGSPEVIPSRLTRVSPSTCISAEHGNIDKVSSMRRIVDTYDYPYIVIYPEVKSLDNASTYGYFNLYPSVYPNIVPYPPMYEVHTDVEEKQEVVEVPSMSVRLTPLYPCFDLYPAAYPTLVIYPDCQLEEKIERKIVEYIKMEAHSTAYGYFNLYPSVYPNIVPYPPMYEVDMDMEEKEEIIETPSMSTRLAPFYPFFDLYPAGYPNLEIYPPVPAAVEHHEIVPSYFYPHIVIYKPVESNIVSTSSRSMEGDMSITLESSYPYFNLYPSVYPYFELYPSAFIAIPSEPLLQPVLLSGATYEYPNICIYPPITGTQKAAKKQLTVAVVAARTASRVPVQSPRTRTRRGSNQWTAPTSTISSRARRGSVNLLDSLAQPPIVVKQVSRPPIRPRKSHQDLHHEVFAQLAPYATDIYGMKIQTQSGSSLRRIASARVDGIQAPATLSRSKTVSQAPPVPILPRAETGPNENDVWGGNASAAATREIMEELMVL